MAVFWGSAILSPRGTIHLTFLVYQLDLVRCGWLALEYVWGGHDYRRECPRLDCVYRAQSRLLVSDLYHCSSFSSDLCSYRGSRFE